jgi:hypothetical protein
MVQERWQDNSSDDDVGIAIRIDSPIALSLTNRTLTRQDTCLIGSSLSRLRQLPSFLVFARDGGGSLLEARLWRRAHRVEPATDVYLGVSFTAIMPRTGGIGRF